MMQRRILKAVERRQVVRAVQRRCRDCPGIKSLMCCRNGSETEGVTVDRPKGPKPRTAIKEPA